MSCVHCNNFQTVCESRMTTDLPIPDDLAACQMLLETQQATIDQLQEQLDQLQNTSGVQTETIEQQQQLIKLALTDQLTG